MACQDEAFATKIDVFDDEPAAYEQPEQVRYILPKKKKAGLFAALAAFMVGSALAGRARKKHDGHCDGDCANCPPHYGYILSLKQQGVVRHIGMSSHTPAVAQMGLDTGLLDMLMFSINPAYDYQRKGEYAIGGARERQALYRRCQAEGVGISVMKAFSGGQLLSGKTSPFGRALTEHQCIQYALDRPGVLTVLPGVRDREDLRRILGYLHAGAEARDYSVFAELTPAEAAGSCVYCNHCHPCPAGLDIGLINKYYDLAQAGDRLAADHYVQLEKHAGDCTRCGHCDRRCPFHVRQSERMKQIREYFGR